MTIKSKPIIPAPPDHLRGSRAWFVEVVNEFALEPHHLKLLTAACEALDRACEARQAVEKDGPYQEMKSGEFRRHPGIATERDFLTLFGRMLRELDLEVTPPAEAKRPPSLRSLRGGH